MVLWLKEFARARASNRRAHHRTQKQQHPTLHTARSKTINYQTASNEHRTHFPIHFHLPLSKPDNPTTDPSLLGAGTQARQPRQLRYKQIQNPKQTHKSRVLARRRTRQLPALLSEGTDRSSLSRPLYSCIKTLEQRSPILSLEQVHWIVWHPSGRAVVPSVAKLNPAVPGGREGGTGHSRIRTASKARARPQAGRTRKHKNTR